MRETPDDLLADKMLERVCAELNSLQAKAALIDVKWGEIPAVGRGGAPLEPGGGSEGIASAYAAMHGGRLVILGARGSGKSTLMLRLAQGLLVKRKQELPGRTKAGAAAERVPVIFYLSAWEKADSLTEWLASELVRLRYDPPLGLERARELIREGRVLPVLDGFDEIGADNRRSLFERLNEAPLQPFVLTSRPSDYQEAVDGRRGRSGFMVKDVTVIELASLEREEFLAYLTGLPTTLKRDDDPQPSPKWKTVAERLEAEPESPAARRLTEVFRTPLMITMARDVYWGEDSVVDPVELLGEKFTSAEQLEAHLLDGFIPAVYDPRRDPPPKWELWWVRRMLRFLVTQSERAARERIGSSAGGDTGTGTRDIAWWEIGAAGMSRLWRAVVTGAAGGLVLAVTSSITAAGATLGIGQRSGPALHELLTGAGDVVAASCGFGLLHWLVLAMKENRKSYVLEPSSMRISVGGLFRTLSGGASDSGHAVAGNGTSRTESEHRRERPWQHLGIRFRSGFVAGFLAAFVGLFGLTAWNLVLVLAWAGFPGGAETLAVRLLLLALTMLGLAAMLGGLLGSIAALEVPREATTAPGPLALLEASRTTALRGCLIGGLVCATVTVLVQVSSTTMTQAIENGVATGLALAFGTMFAVSAWGQWVIFCRGWRLLTWELPWNPAGFLEDAYRRGVLRKAGGFYQFRHIRLQDRI